MTNTRTARLAAIVLGVSIGSTALAADAGFELHAAVDGFGPLLFNDTPDQKLEKTSVFGYGGEVEFLYGSEETRTNRVGLVVGYAGAARSASRKLHLLEPRVVYETGTPVILQLGFGYAAGLGTDGFAKNYSGIASSAGVRYSFFDKKAFTPIAVSIGATSQFIASTTSMRYSSAFVGIQMDLSYHMKPGGAK